MKFSSNEVESIVSKWLKIQSKDFYVEGINKKLPHSPYYPDLAPSDFPLFEPPKYFWNNVFKQWWSGEQWEQMAKNQLFGFMAYQPL